MILGADWVCHKPTVGAVLLALAFSHLIECLRRFEGVAMALIVC